MKYDDFINSTEHQRIYDEIVPIGFNCAITFALRDLLLRHASYPLDWVRYMGNMVGLKQEIGFICKEFKDFMNESDLYIAYDNHENEHDPFLGVYNRNNNMRYLHDFPKGKTIAESYLDIREKYDRRIERLMDLINSNKKVCFVFYAGLAELPKQEILDSVELLNTKFPNFNVDFLFLQNDVNIGDDIVYEEISEQIRRIVFFNGPYEDAFQSDMTKVVVNLKQIVKALVGINKKYLVFQTSELSSNFCVDGVISNPAPDFNDIVSFGPYVSLNSGNHTVTVDYELTDNYRAFVDIACDKGKTIVPKIELPHNQKQFKFDFTLDKNVVDLEVRFYTAPMEQIDENNKFKLFGIRID